MIIHGRKIEFDLLFDLTDLIPYSLACVIYVMSSIIHIIYNST